LKSAAPKYLSLQLHGPKYSTHAIPQSFNLTLFCDPQSTSDPKFVAYDGSRLDLEWHAPAGCPLQEDGDKDEGDKDGEDHGGKEEKAVGSGIGWFFLVYVFHSYSFAQI